MKIISFTDVITNSSSETFLIKSDSTPEEFTKELLEVRGSEYYSSGLGGKITVMDDWEGLEKGYLIVNLDRELDTVIDYLRNYYGILQDLNYDQYGPYTSMYIKWGKNRISELEKEVSNVSSEKQEKIYQEIRRIKTFLHAYN